MNLSPGTTKLTRDEKILALALMIEELKDEMRIEEWVRKHEATVWYQSKGLLRLCTVVSDGRVIAASVGATDDEARAQAFSVVFTNEAAAAIE